MRIDFSQWVHSIVILDKTSYGVSYCCVNCDRLKKTPSIADRHYNRHSRLKYMMSVSYLLYIVPVLTVY